jgi:SAM-dependent methyltransferase
MQEVRDLVAGPASGRPPTIGRYLKVEQPTRGHGALEGYLATRRARMANRLIPSDLRAGRLLDIGCGSYPYFLANTQFAEKWGVDQLFDAEAQLQLGDGHVGLLPFDAQRDATLPFPDDHFSVVTMLAVFEHIATDELGLLLAQVLRVLKPGGIYVATTPAFWTDRLLKTLAAIRLLSSAEINEHKGIYRHAYIARALRNAGFKTGALSQGYFELFMNTWTVATK